MEEGFPSSQMPPAWESDSPPPSPERPRFRGPPAVKGLKRPAPRYEAESPDLYSYFAQFDMDDKDIIVCCRGYASYLAARGKGQRKD